MKNLTYFILLLCTTAVITSCCEKKPTSSWPSKSYDKDVFKNDSLVLTYSFHPKAIPVESSMYRLMIGSRYFNYNIVSNSGNVCPNFVDPICYVSDLIHFRNLNLAYDGMRIYPGLTEDNSMFPIISLSNNNDGEEEADKSWRVLNESDYTDPDNPFPLNTPIYIYSPSQYFGNYLRNVLMINKTQPFNYDPAMKLFKRSRYYSWNELYNYFSANISGFDVNNPQTYEGYKVKLEIAYIPSTITQYLESIVPYGDADYHEGFSIVFSVLDKKGNTTLKPIPTSSNRQQQRPLEVGFPCPPRCGKLSPY